MKVTGPSGIGAASGSRPARGGGEGFSIPAPQASSTAVQAAAISAAGGLMGVEALLALQDIGGPLERKRRAVRRAGFILDVLDEIKVALLDGEPEAGDLDRLRRAVRNERENTEDPKLEAVLNEIEIRAAVEVAKLELAGRAA